MKHLTRRKEDFYSHLNIDYITDTDYTQAKRVRKDIEIKNLGEYLEFYVQSDTLLLVDVFENFRKYTNLMLQNFLRLLTNLILQIFHQLLD